MAMHKAAEQRLMEKEKNKSPSYAMRVSLQINKVVWSMLLDGKSFAEAEINDMVRIILQALILLPFHCFSYQTHLYPLKKLILTKYELLSQHQIFSVLSLTSFLLDMF